MRAKKNNPFRAVFLLNSASNGLKSFVQFPFHPLALCTFPGSMIITYLNPLHCADELVRVGGHRGGSARSKKLWKTVVDTRNVKVWLAVEWTAQVMNLMRVPVNELDHAQDKIVGRIQRIENLISTDGESLSPEARPFTSMKRSSLSSGLCFRYRNPASRTLGLWVRIRDCARHP